MDIKRRQSQKTFCYQKNLFQEETGVHMKGDGEVCTLFIDNVDSAVHNGTFICLLNQVN